MPRSIKNNHCTSHQETRKNKKKTRDQTVACNSCKGVLSQLYYRLLQNPEVPCHISRQVPVGIE
eukprot:13208212-Ditylum_brightwellii.AAC.1